MNTTSLEQPTSNEQTESPNPKPYIAGFWRRFFALFIDSLFISLFSFIIASFLKNPIYEHPIIFGFIGYALVVAYFGILNSNVCHGQTIGKKVLNIKVLDLDHQFIDIKISILRASVCFAPICLFNITDFLQPYIFSTAIGLILALIYMVTFYLFVFNSKSRRTLHDFLFNTIVVNEDAVESKAQPLWPGHFIFLGIFSLFIVSYYFIYSYSMTKSLSNNDLTSQLMEISPHILNIENVSQDISNENNEALMSIYNVRVNNYKLLLNPFFAEDFALRLDRLSPTLINENNFIILGLISSYQFGFASKSEISLYHLTKVDGKIQVTEQVSSIGQ